MRGNGKETKKKRVDYAIYKNTLLSSCILPFHSHQLHLIHAFRHRRFNLFRHRPPPVLHRLPLRVLFCAVHGNLSLFFFSLCVLCCVVSFCFVLTTSSSKVCFFLCVFFVCSSVSTKFSPSFIYLILFSSLSCLAGLNRKEQQHKKTTTQKHQHKNTTTNCLCFLFLLFRLHARFCVSEEEDAREKERERERRDG